MIYIYGLVCPIAGIVRYIGKSLNPRQRLRAHVLGAVRGAYDHHTARWLRRLHAIGLVPELRIIEEVQPGVAWQDVERRHIADALSNGIRLTNSTAGGEGLDYLRQEDIAKYREKLSVVMTALWNRPERRAEAKKRSEAAWADPQIRARRLVSQKAALNRPDVKAKVDLARNRSAADPEVRRKKSANGKSFWESEQGKLTRAAINADPEFLLKQSSNLKDRWTDRMAREKLQASRWTPEKRAEQAKRLADRREKMLTSMTPEARAKQAASLKENWARRKALSA